MLLNSSNLRTLHIGFSTIFQEGFAGVAATWPRIAMKAPSTTAEEEYGWLGELPRVREWLGDRVVNMLSAHDYRIKNRDFELTVGVDRNHIEDDKVGIYNPMFNELGRASASHPDELVWGLLSVAHQTKCYDGQYFFDTDHPVLNEQGQEESWSNWGGGAGAPWFLLDVSRALKPIIYQERRPIGSLVALTKPDDDNVFRQKKFIWGTDGRCNVGFGFPQLAYGSRQPLTPESYEAARAALTTLKGDYGRPLGIMPRLLVTGGNNEGAARRVLQSQLVNGGESNPWAGTAELLVSPWLV